MKLNIKILESNKQIEKAILTAILPECNIMMKKILNNLKNNIPSIISNSIINRPEYQSLISGSLRLEFGIPNAASKIDNIIQHWINNMEFKFSPPAISRSGVKSSLDINMIRSDFSDILGSDDASVIDTFRGYSLPWLQWLLLDGTKNIVSNYNVYIKPNPRSRTGLAVMKQSNSSWSVPSEFAGTISDNWITRAIDESARDIQSALESSLS